MYALIAILARVGAYISSIWIVVSFLIFLVKDKPFNWDSVTSLITCTIATIVFAFFAVMSSRE